MIPFSTENGSNEDFLLLEDVAGENGCGSAGECVKRNEIRRSRTARRWWRNQIRDLRFVRVANHQGHAGECGNFFGGALGVAAGDDDSRGGAAGVEFADGVTSLGIGGRGDRAGVEDDDICGGGGVS